MRVSSLSNPRVFDLVSKYFVPAWFSRDFYGIEGDHEKEKREILRIDRDSARRGLGGGNVCVFIIAPKGDVWAAQRVQIACKPENLIPFLEKVIADKKLKPRSKEAIRDSAAKPETVKPKTEGGRLIHVWARLDVGVNRGLGNDRVELTEKQWKSFLPPANAKAGKSWDIPDEIARKIFQYCYPPSPHWVKEACQVKKGKLKATLASSSADEARIKLKGEMELKYPVGQPIVGSITAQYEGVVRADCKKQTLTSLDLVSTKADYVWYWEKKPVPQQMSIALELEP